MSRRSRLYRYVWLQGVLVGVIGTTIVSVLGLRYVAGECVHVVRGLAALARALVLTVVQ